MKKSILIIMVIGTLMFTAACGSGARYASRGMKTLMENSTEDWVKTIKKDCGVAGFGKPFGTVRETLDKDKTALTWKVTFEIDEDITQVMIDGYAKAVWDACVETDGGSLHSCSGYLYDEAWDAERRQVPLNYYIWYYNAGRKEFRVGIYPSNLEDGVPGAVVLKIERWNYLGK